MISTFGKVAINGAQQKLNDKLVEEEERLWQVKFAIFDLWANVFLGLPLFLFRYVTKETAQEVLDSMIHIYFYQIIKSEEASGNFVVS